MTMIGTALDWAHLALVASVLCMSQIAKALLLAFHALFPFPSALDVLYGRSQALQRYERALASVLLNDIERPILHTFGRLPIRKRSEGYRSVLRSRTSVIESVTNLTNNSNISNTNARAGCRVTNPRISH